MVHEPVDLRNGTIKCHDGEFVVSNVHDQVLTHDGQTYEAKITTGIYPRRSADIDAGQTGATVSPMSPSTLFNSASKSHCLSTPGGFTARM